MDIRNPNLFATLDLNKPCVTGRDHKLVGRRGRKRKLYLQAPILLVS